MRARCVLAGSTAWDSSAEMRCAVSSVLRGDRAMVVEFFFPPPHPSESTPDPISLQGVRDKRCERHRQLLQCLVGTIRLEDAGVSLHDLPQGPKRDAFAVREASALPPGDRPLLLFE